MPLQGQGARDNLYNDTSLNRRASREEIDKVGVSTTSSIKARFLTAYKFF